MTPGSDTVVVDYVLHTSPEGVWKAWTDPACVRQWFGSDPNGNVLQARLDVRVGGSFEVTFKDSSGMEHTCFGVYTEVMPCSKLQFTWAWQNEPGVESHVTVVFEPVDDDTRMHFIHAGVGTASAHNYSEGWRSTFEKLDRMLLKKC